MASVYKNRPPARAAVPAASSNTLQGEAMARSQISLLRGMTGWQRHQHFLRNYTLFYGDGRKLLEPRRPVRTDADAIRDEHRFLWADEDQAVGRHLSWEERLAKRYHDKLFKEYALADMSRYREGAVGLRWRTEREVFDGKGQFVCGNKRCSATEGLASYELNFAYVEHSERKQALVKLRLCLDCAEKLHYKQRKERRREEKREAKAERRKDKRARHSAAGSAKGSKRKRRGSHGGGRGEGRGGDATSTSDSESGAEAGASHSDDAHGPGEGQAGEPVGAGPGEEVWLAKPVAEKTQREEFEDYFNEFCGGLLV